MDAASAGAITTVRPGTEHLADFVGGFVAAEGCFTGDGDRRFRFSIGLGARDAGMCELIHDVLRVGSIVHSPRRKAHYDDEVQFAVQATRELVDVVVPFMNAHLPSSHKRQQYLQWRERLLHFYKHRYRRWPCRFDGCSELARAFGLCQEHLRAIRLQ